MFAFRCQVQYTIFNAKIFSIEKCIIIWFYCLVILSCTNAEDDVGFNAHDTITADNWKIEYLIKDDTTRYDDVYIKWSKGTKVDELGSGILNVFSFLKDYSPGRLPQFIVDKLLKQLYLLGKF